MRKIVSKGQNTRRSLGQSQTAHLGPDHTITVDDMDVLAALHSKETGMRGVVFTRKYHRAEREGIGRTTPMG